MLHARWKLLVACLAALPSLPGCSGETEAGVQSPATSARVELLVHAATSTRDVLQALEPAYEKAHGVELTFNFGSSSDLSNQIVAAARADVFLSADEKEMDKVAKAALLVDGTRRALLSNQLVVIEPADAPTIFTAPFEPAQLAGASVKLLSLGNPDSVPAGRYAKAWLEQRGAWTAIADRILPGVDARAALAAVEAGSAQAGIVYRTDAAHSKKVRIVHAVPLEEGPKISYPIAVLTGRPHEAEARALAEFLGSDAARAAWEQSGFVVLPAAGPR